MSYIDIQATLREWEYDPEQISVRKIIGVDGAVKLQMRIELGILQMEAAGRPDGEHPFGSDSLLEHHRQRLVEYEKRNGTTLGFVLTPEQCQELRFEASIYYRRFVSFFVLEEFGDVSGDTSHNIGVFDLCRDHALEPVDRRALESYRPYVLMMDARARAHQALIDEEPASALAHVNRGMMHLRSFFEGADEHNGAELAEQSGELRILRELARDIEREMPEDSLLVARKALRSAIDEERFEEAARLRDTLKELGPAEIDPQ